MVHPAVAIERTMQTAQLENDINILVCLPSLAGVNASIERACEPTTGRKIWLSPC